MKGYYILPALIAFAIYAAVAAAFIAQLWFMYRFFEDQKEKTEGTKYLAKFYFVLFILSCVGAGFTALGMLGMMMGMPFVMKDSFYD